MRLLVLLVLASIGLGPLPAWAQAVKVGAVVPLTGRYGAGGAQVRAGYEIAVEHLNAAGGVMVAGKKVPIELTLLDDESDATKTVSRFETLAAQGVVAYLGGFGSDLHAASRAFAISSRPSGSLPTSATRRRGSSPSFPPPSARRPSPSSRRRRTGGGRWPRRGRRPPREAATRWW